MKSITTAVMTFIMVVMLTPAVFAQNTSSNTASPVEAFFCNMQAGKTMDDLMKVANKFSKWAEKKNPEYSAWILTPRFAQFGEMPQIIWLGSNPNGNSMGKGLAEWSKSGNDIQAEFDKVVNCGSHALASSVEINVPDGPPGDGVVMFSQCSIDDDSDWRKAIEAHKKFSGTMRSLGAKNSNWLFFPMLGGVEDRGFDYWGVTTFNGWADYFAAYELYVSGGGWQKYMESLNGVASCNQGAATVWDVKLVRQGEQ